MTRFVGYYRVSSARQGLDGFSLDAQRHAVQAHIKKSEGELVAEFQDIRSGSTAHRPGLQNALNECRLTGATLIVAKLDRFSREVRLILDLLDNNGVGFVFLDLPEASRMVLTIMAAIAEHELSLISERTKAGLAEAKRQGQKLGSARPGHWDGNENARLTALARGRKTAARNRHEKAAERDALLIPVIYELLETAEDLSEVARGLSERHIPSPSGKPFWASSSVAMIINRNEKQSAQSKG